MSWAVLCDFDHTITTEDVTDCLLERYALPQWRQIENLWEQGFIGSRECMQQQMALIRATPAQVDALADDIIIDPHFTAFSAFCASIDVPLIITSDGLDYVIESILRRHGIPHRSIIASHLEYIGGERWELTSPFAQAGCSSNASTCKCAMARRLRQTAGAEQILYIGDGRSDFCVSAQEADFILAKDSLLTYCQQQQLPHRAFASFAEAAQIMKTLMQPNDNIPMTAEPLYA